MISKAMILGFIMLLASCGSHIVFRTSKCNQDIAWASHIIKPDFIIKSRIHTPLGFWYPTQVDITQLLKKKNIECSQIKSLSLVVSTTWTDILKTLIPLAATKTFTILGKYQ